MKLFLISLLALTFTFAPAGAMAASLADEALQGCGLPATTGAETQCLLQGVAARMTSCVGNRTGDAAVEAQCFSETEAAYPAVIASCRSSISATDQACLEGYIGSYLGTYTPHQRASWAGDGSFVPLTQIPGIEDVADSGTLPNFLNTIYQLCIGAAAVLAVLQIMRGGMSYMLGDSVTEKKEAKDLIVMSIVGLLLVLSPAIVFGLIDPRILNLQIGFSELRVPINGAGTGSGTGTGDGNSEGQPGTEEGPSGEDNGGDDGGDAGADTDGDGDADAEPPPPEELPDEIIIDGNPQSNNTITAGNATVSITAGDFYTSVRTANAQTSAGTPCKLIQVTDFVRDPAPAAQDRCEERMGSYNVSPKCVRAGGNISTTVQNACIVRGSPLIMRESYN